MIWKQDSLSRSHIWLIQKHPTTWLHPGESFSLLQTRYGPSIHMGDDTQIRAEGNGSINLKHGVFRNVLYVPCLAASLLYVYQMTHTGSPKWVVFGPDLVEITYILTGNIIAKGVGNHASKAYEF